MKRIGYYLSLVFSVTLIYFNLAFWHLPWLGWLVLPTYFWLISEGLTTGLVRFWAFTPGVRARVLAFFLTLALAGWFSGLALIFWRWDNWSIVAVLTIVAIIAAMVDYVVANAQKVPEVLAEEAGPLVEIPQNVLYIFIFILFFFSGLLILWQGKTGAALASPWQAIADNYIYLFFLVVLSSGGLIFSLYKTRLVLFFLILQFLLLFSFLPLSHQLFYGADGWRHLATLEQIQRDGFLAVKNFAETPNWLEKINPGIFSYSQFWGILSLFETITGVDSLVLIRWFQPLLAGVLLPTLLYILGLSFGWGKRKTLIFVWLGLWPFALQMVGAFTLPVGWGFLVWLSLMVLLVRHLKNPSREKRICLLFLGGLSLFGYGLYFIFFWAAWFLAVVLKKIEKKSLYSNRLIFTIIIFLGILFIPVVELVAGYAKFNFSLNVLSAVKQLAGNFTAFYLASGPRPHIIETGNIFFNQIPSYAFVVNGLTVWRWWLLLMMILFIVVAFLGWRRFWQEKNWYGSWWAILILSTFGGYVLSRYFLAGEHLLSRRLEAVLALGGLILFFNFAEKIFNRQAAISLLFILAMTAASTASYSLGPSAASAGLGEYQATEFIWKKIKNDDKFCVLGDTFSLLVLEGHSAKRVIGGGFPIDKNFGQPTLTTLYNFCKKQPSEECWSKAKNLTGAKTCYLILEEKVDFYGPEKSIFGQTRIYSQ